MTRYPISTVCIDQNAVLVQFSLDKTAEPLSGFARTLLSLLLLSGSNETFFFASSHGFHHLSQPNSPLSPGERRELARRRMALLRYLLRSPFYDAVTKRILAAAVEFAERHVPLGGTVAALALGYLPHYREIYSYLWSN